MDAAEIGLLLGFAVEGIKIFAEKDAGAEMIVQSLFIVNDLGLALANSEQGATSTEAGDKNLLAINQRVGIIGVTTGFSGETRKLVAGLRFHGYYMFGS